MTKYTYDYPMPSVTVDAVIFCNNHILLIRRGDEPFKGHWALPGGYMNIDETLVSALIRETKEETDLDLSLSRISTVGVFDAPDRDTRGRVITVAFWVEIPEHAMKLAKAGDDADMAAWHPLILNLPKMAFDHSQIIAIAIEQRKEMNK